MSWMRHNLTLVTHSMWSFWGWVEQSTLKCIDLCFFIIIIVIIIIFNGGNPPVTNPHHYHYCQNPTMVGFWLVGICRLAIVIIIKRKVFWTLWSNILIKFFCLYPWGRKSWWRNIGSRILQSGDQQWPRLGLVFNPELDCGNLIFKLSNLQTI